GRRRCVLGGFPLRYRRAAGREVDDVRRQTLRREFERDARSRRVLVEEVDDGSASERGHLLYHPRPYLPERLRCVEDPKNVGGGDVVDRQKVSVHGSSTTTASSPSIS